MLPLHNYVTINWWEGNRHLICLIIIILLLQTPLLDLILPSMTQFIQFFILHVCTLVIAVSQQYKVQHQQQKYQQQKYQQQQSCSSSWRCSGSSGRSINNINSSSSSSSVSRRCSTSGIISIGSKCSSRSICEVVVAVAVAAVCPPSCLIPLIVDCYISTIASLKPQAMVVLIVVIVLDVALSLSPSPPPYHPPSWYGVIWHQHHQNQR